MSRLSILMQETSKLADTVNQNPGLPQQNTIKRIGRAGPQGHGSKLGNVANDFLTFTGLKLRTFVNQPTPTVYGIHGVNTAMTPDDHVYGKFKFGRYLVVTGGVPSLRNDMINPAWSKGLNAVGATQSGAEMRVNNMRTALPFSRTNIDEVGMNAITELKKNTKEFTSAYALNYFDPALAKAYKDQKASSRFSALQKESGKLTASNSRLRKNSTYDGEKVILDKNGNVVGSKKRKSNYMDEANNKGSGEDMGTNTDGGMEDAEAALMRNSHGSSGQAIVREMVASNSSANGSNVESGVENANAGPRTSQAQWIDRGGQTAIERNRDGPILGPNANLASNAGTLAEHNNNYSTIQHAVDPRHNHMITFTPAFNQSDLGYEGPSRVRHSTQVNRIRYDANRATEATIRHVSGIDEDQESSGFTTPHSSNRSRVNSFIGTGGEYGGYLTDSIHHGEMDFNVVTNNSSSHEDNLGHLNDVLNPDGSFNYQVSTNYYYLLSSHLYLRKM